ncbi:hypothetical protein [Rossellomorea marisflavi]|uniref:hypothetical protein n=1 Tax=Rossellomorea marisflavi TaxID=189381 RepID=UPI003FA0A13C
MSEITRESYVESELKKWAEKYEIGLEQEFLMTAILELQYQYKHSKDEHIKSKGDLLKTITHALRDLNLKLKKKVTTYKANILIKADNERQQREITDLVMKLVDQNNLVSTRISKNDSTIETDKFKLRTLTGDTKGMRADHIFQLGERNSRKIPNSKDETWFVDIGLEDGGYKLKITKHNLTSDGGGSISNLNKSNMSKLHDLGRLLLESVQVEKPSRLIFDKSGFGLGLYYVFTDLVSKSNIMLDKDGSVNYLK